MRKKEERDGGATIHNEWISGKAMPRGVNKIIRPEHMCWDDYAEWDDSAFHVDWNIKMRVFTDAVSCSGRNRFVGQGNSTRVVLSGELDIALKDIPGFPRVIAKRLKPRLEQFIVNLVTPNLKRVNLCLQEFLDDNA